MIFARAPEWHRRFWSPDNMSAGKDYARWKTIRPGLHAFSLSADLTRSRKASPSIRHKDLQQERSIKDETAR